MSTVKEVRAGKSHVRACLSLIELGDAKGSEGSGSASKEEGETNSCLQKRIKWKLDRGGVTSRVCYKSRRSDLISVDLCQAIHCFLLELWCKMLPAIPAAWACFLRDFLEHDDNAGKEHDCFTEIKEAQGTSEVCRPLRVRTKSIMKLESHKT